MGSNWGLKGSEEKGGAHVTPNIGASGMGGWRLSNWELDLDTCKEIQEADRRRRDLLGGRESTQLFIPSEPSSHECLKGAIIKPRFSQYGTL